MRDGGNGPLAKRAQTKKLQSGGAKELRSARPANSRSFASLRMTKLNQVTNLYQVTTSWTTNPDTLLSSFEGIADGKAVTGDAGCAKVGVVVDEVKARLGPTKKPTL